MEDHSDGYKEIEYYIDVYVKHGINGLAAFHAIIDYAQYIDKIDYQQAKQLLYDFVDKMFLPEDYK